MVRPRTAFSEAAAINAESIYSLNWVFGGRWQNGWQLYVPLLQHLLKTEAEPDTDEFASAVADWQRQNGIEPTGAIDQSTWMQIVRYWQSIRIVDKTVAAPEQLLVAPVSDFSAARGEEFRYVEHEAYASFKRMVAAAVADKSLGLKVDANGELAPEERFFKIMSSFRTPAYQAQLRRRTRGGRAGVAVNSPHFTGRTFDIYVGGDAVNTAFTSRAAQIQTPVYRWLVKNAEKFGFVPYFYEPWHWEYRPTTFP